MKYPHIALKIRDNTVNAPDKAAIISEEAPDSPVTYGRLETGSNWLAKYLSNRFPREEERICLLLERSALLIQAVVAVLKAGHIFVPIDPTVPSDRVRLLLNETAPCCVLTTSRFMEKHVDALGGGFEVMLLDKETPSYPEAVEALKGEVFEPIYGKHADIYFTSGSTGVPKGILGRHRSLVHFIQWEIEAFTLRSGINVSQLTPPSFDPYLRDIFVPLYAGGTSIIPSYQTLLDPESLARWIHKEQINLIHMVPSLFKRLMVWIDDPAPYEALQYIFLAGELLRGNDVKKWFELFKDGPRLVNLYGPTETTMAKFFHIIEADDALKAVIPVGKPIKGAHALILDNNKQKTATGNIGEVYIRTPFISSGYFGKQELTKEVFIPNPFGNDDRDIIYKTGDQGRMLSNGSLEILGRIDHQVKIRGFRIELGEIENRLLKYPGMKEAVVIVRESEPGDKQLCAYYVPSDVDARLLKEYLAESLPDYMIPAHFTGLDSIPLTHNGKVDRSALPPPTCGEGISIVPPRNEIEETLVEIWAEVLGLEKRNIGIENNFFDLGGHSLKAADMVTRIHKTFQCKIDIADIFNTPIIRDLSRYISNTGEERKFAVIPTAEAEEYYPVSAAQKRMYVLQNGQPDSTLYNIPLQLEVDESMDLEQITKCLEQLIRRHESLRTSFHILNDEPVQKVHSEVPFRVGAYEHVRQFVRPFDLSRAPLMRAGIIGSQGEKQLLMMDVHHIIADGYSLQILFDEFALLYAGERLEPLKLTYKDYSMWQKEQRENGEIKRQERYWLNRFTGPIPRMEIPTDYPRSAADKGADDGDGVEYIFSTDEHDALRKIAVNENVSMFILILALTNIFLAKVTGNEDIIMGTINNGRNHPDMESVVGMFVNTLALRNNVDPERSFLECLRAVRKNTLEAYENQDFQFEDLVEKINPGDRKERRNPIFDILFAAAEVRKNDSDTISKYSNNDMNSRKIHGNVTRYSEGKNKFDMEIGFIDYGRKKIAISINYKISLFKKETIQNFIDYFKDILAAVISDQHIPIKDIGLSYGLETTLTSAYESSDLDF